MKRLLQSSGFGIVLQFPALLFVIKCFEFLLQETIADRDRKKKQLIKPCPKPAGRVNNETRHRGDFAL